MKSKLLLICTITALGFTLTGCSTEKVFKDKEAGYQLKYDSSIWSVDKNVEKDVAFPTETGTYTFSADFTTLEKTEDGEPNAEFKVLCESVEDIVGEKEADGDELLDEVAEGLNGRLDEGFIQTSSITAGGSSEAAQSLKGYWITVSPLSQREENDPINDVIFVVSNDTVYEFYYTAIGEDNYSRYEQEVNYMLSNLSTD